MFCLFCEAFAHLIYYVKARQSRSGSNGGGGCGGGGSSSGSSSGRSGGKEAAV